MALLSREATTIYLVTYAVARKVLSDRNMGLIRSVFLSVKHQRFVLSVIQHLKTVFWCILSTYMFVCWEGKSNTCYFIMAEAGVPTTLFEVNVSLYLFTSHLIYSKVLFFEDWFINWKMLSLLSKSCPWSVIIDFFSSSFIDIQFTYRTMIFNFDSFRVKRDCLWSDLNTESLFLSFII